jgi:hypothetical protein
VKQNYNPVRGTSADDEQSKPWHDLIDRDATTKGWVCRRCSCLLAPMPRFAIAHVAWHEELDRTNATA